MYIERTKDIQIVVEPQYVVENSKPDQQYYFFSYTIRIANLSSQTVQLLSRRWFIRDGFKRTHEVNGIGVVGMQPVLKPQEVFEYTSFCPLPTPTGSMRGTYAFIDEAGVGFEAKIPVFFLRTDDVRSSVVPPPPPSPSVPPLI